MHQNKPWETPPSVGWHFSDRNNPPQGFSQQSVARLNQVHGAGLVQASTAIDTIKAADAVWTNDTTVCAIRTADCVPILFTDTQGDIIGAIHAGWRGLAKQIIYKTFTTFNLPATSWQIWIGPHIRQPAFEVRADLKSHFPDQAGAFEQVDADHWLCSLETLVLNQLHRVGIQDDQITLSKLCTFSHPERMYSYRRDPGLVERHVSQIWKLV